VGALLALLSSLLWGTGDFLAGYFSRRRAALSVLGGSQIVGFFVMLVIATATRSWGADPAGYLGWAIGASVAGFLGLLAFYTALASCRMGVVSPIAALGVLVPLAAGLIAGELPTGLQYLGIVLAIVGVVLASGPEISGATGARPVLLAAFAALCFGLFLVFVAKGAQESAIMTMTAQRSVTALIVVGLAVGSRSVGGLQRNDIGWLIAIGTFDIVANLMFALATTQGLLAIVSVLGSLYPVVTVVLAWAVLRERLAPAQYVGVAVALVGVAAISAG